ncbi:MAG TPA: APC family permease [Streptosporangiaceae bacterium]|nr:APC family permease [Streptosporangiaceae bacterium]
MSSESLPLGESKSPLIGVAGQELRLRRGVLGIVDISAATMANIGPAMSFFFGFGLLAITAGVAAPLTIVVAIVAIAFLGNTLSQFSRAQPSTGGFITFVGKSFGGTSAVTTALVAGLGYIIAMSSVIAISGGFLSITLNRYLHWNIPWGILTVLLTLGAVYMMIRGVSVSTKVAGFFFVFEMVMLVVVSVAALVKNGGHLSLAPFEPSHIKNGFSGLAAGFPLAIYLFIGWENSAALAEETDNPRRNVPRAVFTSIVIMGVSYLVFAYATVTGFGYNVTKLGAAQIPFISVAQSTLGALAFFAYLAGMTSTLGALIAGTNSQARLVFSAGRERLLPAWIGKVNTNRRTPMNAIFLFIGISGIIIGGWALGHVIGGTTGSLDPINYFFESSTMGTILVLVVYLLANLALPFYYRRYRPQEFSVVKHAVLPALGAVVIVVPLYYLAKPGQPTPYNWFPYAALAVVVIAAVWAFLLNSRDPELGGRVGSLVADE